MSRLKRENCPWKYPEIMTQQGSSFNVTRNVLIKDSSGEFFVVYDVEKFYIFVCVKNAFPSINRYGCFLKFFIWNWPKWFHGFMGYNKKTCGNVCGLCQKMFQLHFKQVVFENKALETHKIRQKMSPHSSFIICVFIFLTCLELVVENPVFFISLLFDAGISN